MTYKQIKNNYRDLKNLDKNELIQIIKDADRQTDFWRPNITNSEANNGTHLSIRK